MVGAPGLLALVDRRESLLRHLAATPDHPSDLAAALECSRSTIDRALSELRDATLVERDPDQGSYHLTIAGELALEEFTQFSTRLERTAAASNLLASLPTDGDCWLPWQFLDSATVVTNSRDPARLAASLPPEIDRQTLRTRAECDSRSDGERTTDRETATDTGTGVDASTGTDKDSPQPHQNTKTDLPTRTLQALLDLGHSPHHQVLVPGPMPCLASAYRATAPPTPAAAAPTDADPTRRELEIIGPSTVIQGLLTEFQTATADALSRGNLSLHELESVRIPPYGLVVITSETATATGTPETHEVPERAETSDTPVTTNSPSATTPLVILLVCPDDKLEGLLVATTHEACTWAQELIESMQEAAQPLSTPSPE
ncbi:helix-turn-helix domain-containing protein [Natrialba asiatica]|uniref:HVO-A0261-like N-terminal domain-containing protein n=1 Tax=Natrialba asiatica (strain ATCC 700177 / DSM 12278 / JCM 9576 / FERM P-10747 / NBRC 102637 / 172P1) TaxID=29540 RepID=M0ATQ1_NATA1|nr:transcriptional regulator [Natrialba asiatica]ELZ00754.1 hypothetical protein C481_10985 [Natrialba asiatica DSM 12278]